MTDTAMWGIWTEAAAMLDTPDCDWRTLQQIERLLRSLSTELERVAEAADVRPHHMSRARPLDSDLRCLQRSLAWVRRHEYDALESVLQTQLDTALRCAGDALDRLEQLQHEASTSSLMAAGSADGR